MSKLLNDIEFKHIVDDLIVAKSKLQNGNIALCLNLKNNSQQVIMREFRGEWQFRKFMIEACMLRLIADPKFTELKKINATLKSFYKFLKEKERIQDDKIV